VHRVYVKFSGPREAWQVFDFATEYGRGRFIAAHRRAFSAWAIEDGCTGVAGAEPPPHLPIVTNEERARQHGARLR